MTDRLGQQMLNIYSVLVGIAAELTHNINAVMKHEFFALICSNFTSKICWVTSGEIDVLK